MAVSPLIPPSPSASNSLKNVATKASAPTAAPLRGPTQDAADREITEQMNDEVRHKYIKGFYCHVSCVFYSGIS